MYTKPRTIQRNPSHIPTHHQRTNSSNHQSRSHTTTSLSFHLTRKSQRTLQPQNKSNRTTKHTNNLNHNQRHTTSPQQRQLHTKVHSRPNPIQHPGPRRLQKHNQSSNTNRYPPPTKLATTTTYPYNTRIYFTRHNIPWESQPTRPQITREPL